MKVYYTEQGEFLYSRHWPTVPEVQISIYKDEIMYQKYRREMEFLLRYPVKVLNPEKITSVLSEPPEPNKFYELDLPFKISGNNITIL